MATRPPAGNFVSEWFGRRIYPVVRLTVAEDEGEKNETCPFLSEVLHRQQSCIKNANSKGVCTINSASNGSRQDWLVCPYRVISSDIVRRACQLIFGLEFEVMPVPVTILQQEADLRRFTDRVDRDGAGYVFFQDKLGGEISVIGTDRSPEICFDVTLVEIKSNGQGGYMVSRYGILELQTMDYHGTYKHAVENLTQARKLHLTDFPAALAKALERWAGKDVEGPNIANVFKRTFYQMLLKFKLAGDGSAAAGTVLALPRSVWDSWQPFLGAPELEDESPGIKQLKASGVREAKLNAFLCIFDLDASAKSPISPVKIEHFIRVSPERMAHHAFTQVPDHILHAIQTEESILARIRTRLAKHWPSFYVKPAKLRSRSAPSSKA